MFVDKINSIRLADYFKTLCEIDSPGKQERDVALFLRDFFSRFPGVIVEEDNSASATGSNTGNLIVTIPSTDALATPLFFNCHMDVINPCLGVEVDFIDGLFTSRGETVLGGDDKAGIAILMELCHILCENDIRHPLVQFIFTTGEEIGLLGATHLDHNLVQAEYGFALDSTGVDNCIIGAPAAVYVDAVVTGKAAHAGLNPEAGLNAIAICADAISHLSLGRIDPDTTTNIGLIEGGSATNIIAEEVRVKGEIRSHKESTLVQTIDDFRRIFTNSCSAFGGHVKISFPPQYPAMSVSRDSPVAQLVHTAAMKLNRDIEFIVAGGGSDANIFNADGLATVILGIGMENVHSTNERIRLGAIVRTLELAVAIVSC